MTVSIIGAFVHLQAALKAARIVHEPTLVLDPDDWLRLQHELQQQAAPVCIVDSAPRLTEARLAGVRIKPNPGDI